MYYGYIRVSTETQAEKGGGLDVQKAAIEKYAKDNGITLEEIFCDAGISGTQESRPELDRLLLETIREGDHHRTQHLPSLAIHLRTGNCDEGRHSGKG